MGHESAKQCLKIFAAGLLFSLSQCGVKLPPKNDRVQSGPHQAFLMGDTLPVDPETFDEKKKSP